MVDMVKPGMNLNDLPRADLNSRSLSVNEIHRRLAGRGDAHDIYGSSNSIVIIMTLNGVWIREEFSAW